MEELDFDIVIVGAGPAGSSAAHEAARNGSSVAWLEKESVVAETLRTSVVTGMKVAKSVEWINIDTEILILAEVKKGGVGITHIILLRNDSLQYPQYQ